jgi:hypothetical protein
MCEWGNTKPLGVRVPANLSHTGKVRLKIVDIDKCIYDIVKALNDAGIFTVASCCGHGKQLGSIILENNREMRVMTFAQGRKVDKMFPPINPK